RTRTRNNHAPPTENLSVLRVARPLRRLQGRPDARPLRDRPRQDPAEPAQRRVRTPPAPTVDRDQARALSRDHSVYPRNASVSMTQPAPAADTRPAAAPTERGWGKLLLAFAAFIIVPTQLRALLPVDSAILLFVPALATCALVGWWAGGRVVLTVIWVALAVWITAFPVTPTTAFDNLVRGWSLLL